MVVSTHYHYPLRLRYDIFFYLLAVTWEDVVKQSNLAYNFDQATSTEQSDMDDSAYGVPYGKLSERPLNEEYSERGLLNQLAAEDQLFGSYDADALPDDTTVRYFPNTNLRLCQLDAAVPTCPRFEKCELVSGSRQGVCTCKDGYERLKQAGCIRSFSANVAGDAERRTDDDLPMYDGKSDSTEAAEPSPIQKLSVSVISKDVQLPEKEVTLAAYTVPDEKTAGVPYVYSWSLIAQPTASVNGTMSDQSKDKITLSNLSEGLYQFQVLVKGKDSIGEAFGNVTVLPEKRINRAPTVVITPKKQIVKWPTSGAILDGSSSQVCLRRS